MNTSGQALAPLQTRLRALLSVVPRLHRHLGVVRSNRQPLVAPGGPPSLQVKSLLIYPMILLSLTWCGARIGDGVVCCVDSNREVEGDQHCAEIEEDTVVEPIAAAPTLSPATQDAAVLTGNKQ